jgi:syntaxin-binding protein 5
MPPSWLKAMAEHAFGGSVASPPPQLEHANWSGSFSDSGSHKRFAEGILANLVLPGEVTAMACEPVLGYLAVGTNSGTIHFYGSPPVQISITLRPAVKVKELMFRSGSPLLICIGESLCSRVL